MKVLHVIAAVAERYGGPSAAICDMARALRDAGVDVALATTDADGAGRLAVETGSESEWKGIRTSFFRRQWSESLKYSGPLARWLATNVHAFDVVHAHGVFSHSTLCAGRAARRAGVPYVIRTLGQLDGWSLAQNRGKKALFLSTVGKRLLSSAAAMHYTTDEERLAAVPVAGRIRSVVIPIGVTGPAGDGRRPEALPQDWGSPEKPFVLSLGRLHPKKRLELLLEAVRELPELRLVIAGDGEVEYVGGLREGASGLAAERVRFLGWLGTEEKAWVFRRAALFALPSHSENFGIAVAEAMAAGLPVLVSSGVNIASSIAERGAGWVVDVGDPNWKATLSEAVRDAEERRFRGKRARALALAAWNWPDSAAKLRSLYDSLARRRTGAEVS